ncbi:MAG TPA: DUF1697 domain-containing protein [Pyrinomonadaceae bacterium]|nr:DUF1697 domain-containing protein [Pyrinomonadaceae bacterium]
MPKYVAFLRAINVGGHTVKMEHLRRLFEAQGFSGVETFIASGNVIFDSASANAKALEKKIGGSLREALGYEVATFLRSTGELLKVARHKPFAAAELEREGNVLYVAFLADRPGEEAARKLLSYANEVDDFHVSGREVYWLRRTKVGESKFSGALLERTLGAQATVRNSTTVRKLAAKYASGEGTTSDVIMSGGATGDDE